MYDRVNRKCCNIPREVCNMFASCCAICAKQRAHVKKAKAGARPILTMGFGGQIDLVDYQSMQYGGMRYLLTYVDHGLKFSFVKPIPDKSVSACVIGTVCIITECTSELCLAHAVTGITTPNTDKQCYVIPQGRTIALTLIPLFCLIGPPCILQPDNGREFSRVASRQTRPLNIPPR